MVVDTWQLQRFPIRQLFQEFLSFIWKQTRKPFSVSLYDCRSSKIQIFTAHSVNPNASLILHNFQSRQGCHAGYINPPPAGVAN